jgi:hypothetical protein
MIALLLLSTMFQLVFVVIDRFDVHGKGTALTGIAHDDSLHIPIGTDITIKRSSLPDIQSQALGFEVLRNCWSPNKPRNFCVLLPTIIGAENVPLNSEIWCDI